MSEESKKFVKRFTTVPEKFIDELFRFYNEDTKQTDIVISLDDISKWLNCLKKDLIETLRRSYIEHIDYTIEKTSNPNNIKGVRGSNNYKKVMVTPDTFKRLIMLSRTKKAEIVRTYFIDVETQFLRYKDQLMEGLKSNIERLQTDLNPNKNNNNLENSNGYIYVIKASDEIDNLFKVGRAKNIKTRLFSYQTGKAHNVELLYLLSVHNMKDAEKCIKSQLKEFQYRTRREIYQVPLNMLKKFIDKCNEFDGLKKEYKKKQNLSGGNNNNYYAVFNKQLILPFDKKNLQS
jgi:phage anti-repressor protein